jgi:integrase
VPKIAIRINISSIYGAKQPNARINRGRFRKACVEDGISGFVFHDLPHIFGTRRADAGVDVVKIKGLMGRASITTTMRYMYALDKGKKGGSG